MGKKVYQNFQNDHDKVIKRNGQRTFHLKNIIFRNVN